MIIDSRPGRYNSYLIQYGLKLIHLNLLYCIENNLTVDYKQFAHFLNSVRNNKINYTVAQTRLQTT